jgi:hypothetical protein
LRVRRREGPGGLRPRDRAAPQQGADSAALRAGRRHVARAVDAAEVARKLLSGAVELGGRQDRKRGRERRGQGEAR